ncbi:hypothetical protein [Hyphomicrobium sp.]|uniref:hypothetical protein n=1 Tax=Hyphomicrobium sp. TaxID=82 RepID=UPI002FE09CCC
MTDHAINPEAHDTRADANSAIRLRRQLAALMSPPKPPAIASVVLIDWPHIDRALAVLDLVYAARDGGFLDDREFLGELAATVRAWNAEK